MISCCYISEMAIFHIDLWGLLKCILSYLYLDILLYSQKIWQLNSLRNWNKLKENYSSMDSMLILKVDRNSKSTTQPLKKSLDMELKELPKMLMMQSKLQEKLLIMDHGEKWVHGKELTSSISLLNLLKQMHNGWLIIKL